MNFNLNLISSNFTQFLDFTHNVTHPLFISEAFINLNWPQKKTSRDHKVKNYTRKITLENLFIFRSGPRKGIIIISHHHNRRHKQQSFLYFFFDIKHGRVFFFHLFVSSKTSPSILISLHTQRIFFLCFFSPFPFALVSIFKFHISFSIFLCKNRSTKKHKNRSHFNPGRTNTQVGRR